MLGRLPGGGDYRFLVSLRDRLRRGIRMGVGGRSRGKLDDTPPPPGRSDSTPRPGPSARLRDRPPEL